MIKKSVLVTRPALVAAETREQLSGLGYHPVMAPMLDILPLESQVPSFETAPYVYVTSQTALRIVSDVQLAPFLSCPCFCVGNKTAAIAQSRGFKTVHVGARGSIDLARKVLSLYDGKSSVLHISAEIANREGIDFLKECGIPFVSWQVYRAVPVQSLPQPAIKAIKEEKLLAALFFSARTGQTFKELIEREGLVPQCAACHVLALSQSIADQISVLPWRSLSIVERPQQTMMIAKLKILKGQDHD